MSDQDLRVQPGVSTVTRVTSDNNGYMTLRSFRDGVPITAEWKQALVFEGRGFMLQFGTEDAPINSTTSIDDQLVTAVVDVATGTTVLPFFGQAVIGTWTSSTLLNYMIEIDRAKARYSSGGTAFTALNLRSDNPIISTSTVYVGDVTVAAKTSSGSLEVYRESMEVNLGDVADFWPKMEYSPLVCPVLVGPCSILVHLGAATADVTAYGNLMWFEIPSNSVT